MKWYNKLLYLKWSDIKRSLKFFWQRRTRGFDDSETFSLDYSLAALIAPRLKRFREITIAHPCDMSEKEWNKELDKMIAAFEFASSDKRWDYVPEKYKEHQEGLDLFAKYFFSLWW